MRDIIFKFYDRHRESKKILTSTWDIYDILHGEAYEPEVIFERIAICQYTGLKDKNGKMIFEGDIVRDTVYGWTETVEMKIQSDGCGLCSGYHSYVSEEKQLEVIGNIYENPELLEGGK